MTNYKLIQDSIVTVPDFPIKGILFRDITSLLEDPAAFEETVKVFVEQFKDKGITKIVGTESRGFIFGAPVALALGLPLVLVRKPGKLPRPTERVEYELEYGTDALEIHKDSIKPGDRVLVIDDLLATGGTVSATVELIRRLGGVCNDATFVINLKDLPGKQRLEALGVNVYNIIEFEGE